MEKYFDFLSETKLFSGLSKGELRGLLSCLGADVLSVKRKSAVFLEGERAEYIYLVVKGKIQLEKNDYYGNRSIISTVGEGELFAEEFACSDARSIPVSAAAAEDSIIVTIPAVRVLYTCESGCDCHKKVIYNLMRQMAEKNIVYHRRLEITSKRTTRDKLIAFLTEEEKLQGSPSFDIPFTREELADYLEVDRSGLCTEIGKLVKEGAIKTSRGHFELLKQK